LGQFEVSHAKKDRKNQEKRTKAAYSGESVSNRKPNSGQYDPKKISQAGSCNPLFSDTSSINEFLAEWKGGEACYAESGYPEWDTHNRAA